LRGLRGNSSGRHEPNLADPSKKALLNGLKAWDWRNYRGQGLISPLFHEGAQNLWATPPLVWWLSCLPILIRRRDRGIRWAGYSIVNADDDADAEFAAQQGSGDWAKDA
jgi:hypothetical protein